MLSKEIKQQYRSDLFKHLDGIVTAPTAYSLLQNNILDHLLTVGPISLHSLSQKFKANEGYFNVALRILASQGWVDYDVNNKKDEIIINSNDLTALAIKYIPLYKDVVHLMKFSENFHPRKFEKEPFLVLNSIFEKYRDGYGITPSEENKERTIQEQVLKHIEGILVGPTTVLLGMGGMFHKYFMEASFKPEEYHKDPDSFEKILDFLSHLQWFTKRNGTYQFTDKGLFFAKRASAYGVTVSYIPTLRKLDDLIFGNPNVLREIPERADEIHVDREMNVWGSGGAHAAYFKKIDEIIIDIFNSEPIEEQPKGILDMGCGNGAFLIHLFDLIEKRTKRGQVLEEHPLFLVGVDYNETALKVTRGNIIQADIWAKVIWGDIGDPAQLNQDLKDHYNINLKELLNVRTFLDHNRIWETPKEGGNVSSKSSGAFAHRGVRVSNNLVEQNLQEHLEKWKPYVDTFGLLVIELHTIPPALTATNLGKTAATAYDATHGYSDQYIVEESVFLEVAKRAGLHAHPKHSIRFPNSELATVSINLLKG